MGLDDRLHETETQPESALGATAVAAKQTIENSRLLVRRDAYSAIPDPHQSIRSIVNHLHVDAAAGRRVFERVVDQIRRDLFEASAIADDLDVDILRYGFHRQRHALGL